MLRKYLKSAILKFAARSGLRNSVKKNIIFQGISETDQANFSWALIFWSFLIKQKGH